MPPYRGQRENQADRHAAQNAVSQRAQSQRETLFQQFRNRPVERPREAQVAMHQPGKIAHIEQRDVVVAGPLVADGLLALGVEPRVELPLVHSKTRPQADQCCAQQPSYQRREKDSSRLAQQHRQQHLGTYTVAIGSKSRPRAPTMLIFSFCLAMYIRRSASLSNWSASVPSSGKRACPTLSDSDSVPHTSRPASAVIARRRWMVSVTWSSCSPGSTSTNSSPPMRAT